MPTSKPCWPCRGSPLPKGGGLGRAWTQLPRDHYVRLNSSDYSVRPNVIARPIEVTAYLARVWVFCDGRLVAAREQS